MPELDFESLPAGALTDCSGRNCPGFTDAQHRDHAVLIDPVGWGQKCLLSKYCDNTMLDRLRKSQSEHSRRQVPMTVAPTRVIHQLTPFSRQTSQIPHVSPSELGLESQQQSYRHPESHLPSDGPINDNAQSPRSLPSLTSVESSARQFDPGNWGCPFRDLQDGRT